MEARTVGLIALIGGLLLAFGSVLLDYTGLTLTPEQPSAAPCVQAWHRPCESGTWSVSSWRHTSIMGASSAAAAQSLSAGAGLLSSRGICRLPTSPSVDTERDSTQCICACICKNIGTVGPTEIGRLPVRRKATALLASRG